MLRTSGFVRDVTFSHNACDIGNIICLSVVLEQGVINFEPIRQGALLFGFVVVYNGIKLRTGALVMTTCGALPLVGGTYRIIKAGGEVCSLRLPSCLDQIYILKQEASVCVRI